MTVPVQCHHHRLRMQTILAHARANNCSIRIVTKFITSRGNMKISAHRLKIPIRNICIGFCAGLFTAVLFSGYVQASSQPYIADHGINFAIGNKYLTETDISVEGPVAPLLFARTYNSKSTVNGILGYGWSSTITEHLEFAGSAIIRVLPSGRHINYGDDGSGGWVSQLGKHTTIATVTGGYELKKSDKTVNTYDSQGKLIQIRQRNGYTQTFGYSGTELTSISDNFGKTISFTYNTGKLATLTGPTGTFIYAYENDNLVSVTKPDTTIKHYEYEDANDPHNLTGVVDEAGIQTIHLTYDAADRVETSSLNGIRQITITYPSTTNQNPYRQRRAPDHLSTGGSERCCQE